MFMKRTLIAAAFVAGSAVAASAADLPTPPMAPPPPPPMAAPAFDWSGPYFGFYGGLLSTGGGAVGQAGVQAGYNMTRGSFLFGAEIEAGAIFAGGAFSYQAEADARLGFILGDRFLVYGLGGVGILGIGGVYWAGGGGLELGLRSTMSVFAEGKAIGTFGGGVAGYIVQAGMNFHR